MVVESLLLDFYDGWSDRDKIIEAIDKPVFARRETWGQTADPERARAMMDEFGPKRPPRRREEA